MKTNIVADGGALISAGVAFGYLYMGFRSRESINYFKSSLILGMSFGIFVIGALIEWGNSATTIAALSIMTPIFIGGLLLWHAIKPQGGKRVSKELAENPGIRTRGLFSSVYIDISGSLIYDALIIVGSIPALIFILYLFINNRYTAAVTSSVVLFALVMLILTVRDAFRRSEAFADVSASRPHAVRLFYDLTSLAFSGAQFQPSLQSESIQPPLFTVETKFLRITFNNRNSLHSAEIISGPYFGKKLDELELNTKLIILKDWHSSDEASAIALSAWIGGSHGAPSHNKPERGLNELGTPLPTMSLN
ncbi:MAG: hypothetical protein WCO00_11530 [Rhodospirillaceae bacterium]